MKSGPQLAHIASLIGDRARADMLAALMSGKALTATELAEVAGVTKQTASAHLSKLIGRELLTLEKQGRHRYFRLADENIAQMLESLMSIAQRVGALRLQTGPSEPAMRTARVCYDHLAGEVAVKLFAETERRQLIRVVGEGAELTERGERFYRELGVDVDSLSASRRPVCRVCLDWSERRHHLAGSLGAALLAYFLKNRWALRARKSRIITITPSGAAALRKHFAVRM